MLKIGGLHDKKCASVPVRVKLEEDSLRNEYDTKNDLVLNEFFLRDQSRAILAMKLPGLDNRSVVHAAAEKIPGLHTASHGREPSRTLAIGWDENAVFNAAASASGEQDKKRLLQKDAGWQARVEKARSNRCQARETKRVGRQLRVHHPHGNFFRPMRRYCDAVVGKTLAITFYVLRFTLYDGAIRHLQQLQGDLQGVMRFGVDRASAVCNEFDSEDDHSTSESEADEKTPLPNKLEKPRQEPHRNAP